MATFALIKSEDGSLDLDLFNSAAEAVRAARTWALGLYRDAELPESDDEDALREAMIDEDLPLDFSVVELAPDRDTFDAGFAAGVDDEGVWAGVGDPAQRRDLAWKEFAGEAEQDRIERAQMEAAFPSLTGGED